MDDNSGKINISDISGGDIDIGAITSGLVMGDVVGRDKIVNNITNLIHQAVTAAEEAERARTFATQRLAEGVRDYAQRLATIAAQATAADTVSPYKGLLAYHLSDTDLFFGRDRAIVELLQHLQGGPLTVLHAVSGAGKSSLLQAGISPYLLVHGHLPVFLRPYNFSPTLAIKRAFVPNLTDTPDLADAPLRDFLRQVTTILGSSVILYILLDQFEESFTLLNKADRAAFADDLADCLDDEALNVRWVLALRSEFFGNLANFRPRIRNPFENDYRLNRLTRGEAETVIMTPAARQGISFEPDLVKSLLDDLRSQNSDEVAPPQIQLVCSALYNILLDLKAANPNLAPTITLQMYEEEGKTEEILRGHLNRVLRRTLAPEEREVARQLLIALVSSDRQRIRRSKSDLAVILDAYLSNHQNLDDLLAQLVENRLLIVDRDDEIGAGVYELAHDYLLTEIEIDPEVQARKAAEELLKQEVEAYKRHGTLLSADKFNIINSQQEFLTLDGDQAKLLRLSRVARRRAQMQRVGAVAVVVLLIIGAAVAIAVIQSRSAEQQSVAAATAEAGATQAKIAESTAQFEATRALNAEETAQAEANKALNAEATARAEKGIADQERDRADKERIEAEQQANVAFSRQLAAQSLVHLNDEFDLALLLGVEANRVVNTDTFEAHRSLLATLNYEPRLLKILHPHKNFDWRCL